MSTGQLTVQQNEHTGVWDIALEETGGEHLARDYGLRSAIVVSLFTDQRIPVADARDPSILGGWWGDSYPDQEAPDFQLGSLLWTLVGKKSTQDTLDLAESYCQRALGWMVTDGWVESLDVSVEAVTHSILGASITLHRPKGSSTDITARWEFSL